MVMKGGKHDVATRYLGLDLIGTRVAEADSGNQEAKTCQRSYEDVNANL